MKDLGSKQREALFLACHGPLAMVKGLKPQAQALVRKGLLDEDLQPTEQGRALYAELTAPISFNEWTAWHERQRMVAAQSADGLTTYFAERGAEGRTWAIVTSTIPAFHLAALGFDKPQLEIVR